MNILLTSAGRRGYLVNYFKEAIGDYGEVHVANSSNSTAMKYGHHSVVTPLIYSEQYIPFLLKYCLDQKIDALIPLFDIDLPILSNHISQFEKIGVRVIVSRKEVISICNDKWLTFNYLQQNGFNTPRTFLSVKDVLEVIGEGEISFPVIIKPRWGMGSISIFEAENQTELEVFFNKTKRIIQSTYLSFESQQNIENCVVIQEKLDGQEYGLDVINDLEGNYKVTSIKKKIAMRSGETDSAETVRDYRLSKIGEKLSRRLKHIGNLDVDAFIVNETPYVLEMNARFGGGYPFSHLAGVNLPKAIVLWLKDEVVCETILAGKIGVVGYKDIEIIDDHIKIAPLVHS